MRKLILLIILSPFLLIACSKTYTCECSVYFNGTDTAWTKNIGTIEIEAKKKVDAESSCAAQEGLPQTFAGNEYGLTCSLN